MGVTYLVILLQALIYKSVAEITTYRDVKTGEELNKDECWKFTWVGVYEEGETYDCSDFFPEDLCFPPFIYTNSSSGSGSPDLTQIRDKCDSFDDPTKCSCKREATEVCVKYTKFSKDGIPVYYSSFCGSGVNQNNFGEETVDSGCHRDTKSDPGYDKEVCFCKGSMCNTAPKGSNFFSLKFLILTFVLSKLFIG